MEVDRKEIHTFVKNADKSTMRNDVYDVIIKFYNNDESFKLDQITEELLLQTLTIAEDWKLNSLINAICHIIANKIKN